MSRVDPTQLARRTPGLAVKDHAAEIDVVRLRGHRLARMDVPTSAGGSANADLIDAEVVTQEELWRLAQYVRSLSPEEAPVVARAEEAPAGIARLSAQTG